MRAYISRDLSRKHFKQGVYKHNKKRKARYYAGCYVETADNGKEYVRDFVGRSFATYHKRYCNRKIRRRSALGNHSYYRKAEEYNYIVD